MSRTNQRRVTLLCRQSYEEDAICSIFFPWDISNLINYLFLHILPVFSDDIQEEECVCVCVRLLSKYVRLLSYAELFADYEKWI